MAKKRGAPRDAPEEAAEKRRRVASVRNALPMVSAVAFAALVACSRQEAFPEGSVSRRDIRLGTSLIAATQTPYGQIFQTMEVPGSEAAVKMGIQHPHSFLWHVCKVSKCLSDLILRALEASPSTPAAPWNLILYNDEVSPGNQLSFQNKRKLQAVYWTLLELGSPALSEEEAWFEVLLAKSSQCKAVQGGISGVIKHLIKSVFWGDPHNLATAGLWLELFDGRAVQLWIKLGMVLADEAALHSIFGCTGASGLKSCPLCKNVYAVGNQRGIVEGHGRVLHSCCDASKIALWTADGLSDALSSLEREFLARGKGAFEQLETALGWRRHPGGVMGDPALRLSMNPVNALTFDWAHGIFVNGVFQKHAGLLIRWLRSKGPTGLDSLASSGCAVARFCHRTGSKWGV